ncbi:MAG: zinc-binding alcohol dehydrogenase family protein [Verrucomicrobiales bacterium]|nr:zinc-binding alcohol dehydrogenase family protein [Verrucomicrobiales bacterium]
MQTEIRLEEPGRLAAVEGAVPEPAQGETLLRIRRIGVCGTDIHAFHGRQPFFEYPRILGHELGAEVVSVNGDSSFSPGDFVAVEPYLNDPASPASRKGKTNCCESLKVLGVHTDGGMRPFITVPTHKLHRAASASMDQLALVEMLCIGQHAVNRSLAATGDRALILGAGPIGLSVLSFLQNRTEHVAVADISTSRLDFCRNAFGVTHTVEAGAEVDLEKKLRDCFGGQLPDLIFDATGNKGSMHSTFNLAANGARIVFVGLFQGDVTFNDPNFHRRELTLMSSRNATSAEFGEVIAAIESGAVNTAPWITHRLAFDEVVGGFETTISDPTLRKAVIELND